MDALSIKIGCDDGEMIVSKCTETNGQIDFNRSRFRARILNNSSNKNTDDSEKVAVGKTESSFL